VTVTQTRRSGSERVGTLLLPPDWDSLAQRLSGLRGRALAYGPERARHRSRRGERSLLGCRFPPRESTEVERRRFAQWWLDRFADEELADLALGLGVEEASGERGELEGGNRRSPCG
jgi:hypothetical protein